MKLSLLSSVLLAGLVVAQNNLNCDYVQCPTAASSCTYIQLQCCGTEVCVLPTKNIMTNLNKNHLVTVAKTTTTQFSVPSLNVELVNPSICSNIECSHYHTLSPCNDIERYCCGMRACVDEDKLCNGFSCTNAAPCEEGSIQHYCCGYNGCHKSKPMSTSDTITIITTLTSVKTTKAVPGVTTTTIPQTTYSSKSTPYVHPICANVDCLDESLPCNNQFLHCCGPFGKCNVLGSNPEYDSECDDLDCLNSNLSPCDDKYIHCCGPKMCTTTTAPSPTPTEVDDDTDPVCRGFDCLVETVCTNQYLHCCGPYGKCSALVKTPEYNAECGDLDCLNSGLSPCDDKYVQCCGPSLCTSTAAPSPTPTSTDEGNSTCKDYNCLNATCDEQYLECCGPKLCSPPNICETYNCLNATCDEQYLECCGPALCSPPNICETYNCLNATCDEQYLECCGPTLCTASTTSTAVPATVTITTTVVTTASTPTNTFKPEQCKKVDCPRVKSCNDLEKHCCGLKHCKNTKTEAKHKCGFVQCPPKSKCGSLQETCCGYNECKTAATKGKHL